MMGYLFYGFAEVFIARQDAFLKKKFKKITKTQLLTLKICVFLLFHLLLTAIQLFTYIVGEQWTFHDAIYYTFITGAFLGETVFFLFSFNFSKGQFVKFFNSFLSLSNQFGHKNFIHHHLFVDNCNLLFVYWNGCRLDFYKTQR
jgi:hypothetical protein